jgi:hypothetical protein
MADRGKRLDPGAAGQKLAIDEHTVAIEDHQGEAVRSGGRQAIP